MSASETDHDWQTQERRDSQRQPVDFELRLIDLEQDRPLGDVIDISLSGMRLIGDNPMPSNGLRRVRLDIVLSEGDALPIYFKTQCIWSRYVEPLGCYESGCANTLAPAAAVYMAQLIERLKTIASSAIET